MKTLQNFLTIVFFMCICTTYAQSEEKKEEKETPEEAKPKENSSEEIVTKIIRIKGPNGEEKVIKEQQVITKKTDIKLNPDEEDQTNRTAVYSPQKVSIKNSGTTSNEKIYSSVPDGTGYVLTLIDENGEKISKAKPVSNGYYLINIGPKDNCLGRFDESKNLIIETYDAATDSVVSLTYKLK
ncbi:hypothetical protein [Aquimarina sp. 2201CG14-23]|uniref:hypothetical protein n=1 Tax=Aquimarina mycalae TaxID=3040073 RepID=UPI0024781CBF|nr:hypothetical protein [Aquimarina sp. 2201CG14-23]MDH7445800.1 hypothetical protein [Aquimarina sp. 2201CG14-23]